MNRIPFVFVLVCFFTISCSSNDEAKLSADTTVESMNFHVSNLSVGNLDELAASNFAIECSLLLSDEEKERAHRELWKKYSFVKSGGNEDNICFTGDLRGYLYNNDEILKNLIDKGLDRFGNKYIVNEFDKLKDSEAYKYALSKGWCSENDFKNNNVAKVAALYCLNSNNKVLLDASKWLSVKMSHDHNHREIMDLKAQFMDEFQAPSGSVVSLKEEKSSKLYIFKYYSHEQLLQLPTYHGIMDGLLDDLFDFIVSEYQ